MDKAQKYEAVIGIEVHVELNTKSKMFCRCSAKYFGQEPNTQTCPVCLGLPGALPYINQEAITKCIQIGLALNCQANPVSYFERKNYFYPDLAKGYQISQLVKPLCVNGWLEVEGQTGEARKIRINRAHQEEDTGKLTHTGGETLIDFNRSGVPLVEIVTEPDFISSAEVRDYAKKLQQIFRYLEVSEADMEKGQMRLEANVSVRPVGRKELPPYRVELKNINSFRFMVAAIEYEIKRQTQVLKEGEKLSQETRGWNEAKKETYLQRSKEEAHDYRYFPEPDLPPIKTEESVISHQSSTMPELPGVKTKRFIEEFGIKPSDAKILTDTKEMASFFEEAVKIGKQEGVEPKEAANYIVNQKLDLAGATARQVVDDIKAKKSGLVEDETALEKLAQEAVAEDPSAAANFRAGKASALGVLIGLVMKKSSGKANAAKIREILERLLRS